jgi:hypothetical protein
VNTGNGNRRGARGARANGSGRAGYRLPGRLWPLAVLAAVAGCTYSFSGSNLPGYIKTIAIPNFVNDTLEPGLDQEITTAVLDRFIKDGRLKLAPEGKASCRLTGRVVKYENRVYNYTANQSPKDYVVVLTAAVVLRDMVKNRDLWKDDALTRTTVYAPDATSGPATEKDARAEALRGLAGDLIARTMEPW